MRLSAQNLENRRATMPEAVAAIEAAGRREGDWWNIGDKVLVAILRKHAPHRLASLEKHLDLQAKARRAVKPLPKPKWPTWAKLVACRRACNHEGVGDTVYYTIGEQNSETFKVWFYAVFRRECKCPERRARWNAEMPYDGQDGRPERPKQPEISSNSNVASGSINKEIYA